MVTSPPSIYYSLILTDLDLEADFFSFDMALLAVLLKLGEVCYMKFLPVSYCMV